MFVCVLSNVVNSPLNEHWGDWFACVFFPPSKTQIEAREEFTQNDWLDMKLLSHWREMGRTRPLKGCSANMLKQGNIANYLGWHDFFHLFHSMHFFLELLLIDIAQPSSWEDWIKVVMFVGFCPSVGSISLQPKIMQGLSQDKSTTFTTCIY